MSEYATTPISSGGSGSFGLKRDGGGARQRSRRSRRRGPTAPIARGSRGAPTALVTERAPLLQLCGGRGAPTTRRRPARRPEEIRQQRLTVSNSTGIGEQGSIWVQRAQIWALIFFIFEK
jgi:hypothetical protein